jgi:hypothetical protein
MIKQLLLLSSVCIVFFASSQQDSTYLTPETVSSDIHSVIPPNGFLPSEKFTGYFDAKSSASIVMTTIKNITYPMLTKSIDANFALTNKLNKIGEGEISATSGLKGVWYKYTFEIDAKMPNDSTKNIVFVRYLAFVGDLKQTLWLNVTYPQMMDALLDPEIIKCFNTAVFSSQP